MRRIENAQQLRWLMTLRVVTVTTLLVCVFSIELLLRPADTLRPLFALAAAAYGTALCYGVLDRWLKGTVAFTFVQLGGDALLITFFVGFTGGAESPMSFLYLLPISVAAMLLYRGGGLALAALCWSLYATLVFLGAAGVRIPGVGTFGLHGEPGRVVYLLVVHLVAMVAFALLSSYLSERLRTQGRELKERTGAVARLKALNENIIDSINSGLLTTNLGGTINFINRGGTDILGYTGVELEGRSVTALLGLEPGFLDELRRNLLQHRRFRFERHVEIKDQRRIFLGIAASNLQDRAGNALGYIFIFQDLTEIHALEQEMRLKERMVALGEMAAGMAHELRNPLAAISGAVQYLKTEVGAEGEVRELMDIILRESQRLDQAIRDFLTFARPGEFAPQTTDLAKLIQDNVKLLRKSEEFGPRHRIETRFFAPTIECGVDPNRMKQVFWNLATNALKAMAGGGTLVIAVEPGSAPDTLEVRFEDQGRGMDEEQLRRYFQPFSSSFDEGTGLGAAIVYRLVGEHGGKIGLRSQPGGGTEVRITLPRRAAPDDADAPPFPRARAAGG